MDIQKAFNKHFIEFIDDIANIFPDNVEIKTLTNALTTMRQANPKLIMQCWYTNIVMVYKTEIDAGDINFFITKQYDKDLSNVKSNDTIIKGINKLREPIKLMSDSNQQKAMKYMQNLSKLSSVYYLNT